MRVTCRDVAAAQNARDLEAAGAFFVDGPGSLWVSDGRSCRGREAVLARMGRVQRVKVWQVTPSLGEAGVVLLGDDTALLHVPLTLAIGEASAPDRLGLLVSIASVQGSGEDWRIQSLLTTRDRGAAP